METLRDGFPTAWYIDVAAEFPDFSTAGRFADRVRGLPSDVEIDTRMNPCTIIRQGDPIRLSLRLLARLDAEAARRDEVGAQVRQFAEDESGKVLDPFTWRREVST